MIKRSTTMAGAAREVAQLASSNGSRVRLRNRPNTTAPVMSRRTIAEIRRLSTVVSHTCRRVSFRVTRAISSAPKAPTAPASVGVNQPATIPPITVANRSTTSITPVSARSFRAHGTFGPGGPRWGRRQHSRTTLATSTTPTIHPGTSAAVKRRVGGGADGRGLVSGAGDGRVTTARVPPKATRRPESPGSYRYLFISGRATERSVAVVAELERDTVENPMLARMVV